MKKKLKIKNIVAHFMTISEHKVEVMKGCFKVGLYFQGLTHDLSKYSPGEFFVGAEFYQGNRSPNNAEREEKGYSSAWLHHKGRNRHHYEYWVDYNSVADIDPETEDLTVPVKMPLKYVVEMLLDRVAASKIYNKGHYTDDLPLKYFMRSYKYIPMNKETKKLLYGLLRMLSVYGEEKTFKYIRTRLLPRGTY